MSRFEIEVSAAEQLDIVHARIGRLVFQPFLFPPESFPAALLRELRYARTLLCCDSRWERKGRRFGSEGQLSAARHHHHYYRLHRYQSHAIRLLRIRKSRSYYSSEP